MVECTGLENQQSREVLVGSNPTASAKAVSKLDRILTRILRRIVKTKYLLLSVVVSLGFQK